MQGVVEDRNYTKKAKCTWKNPGNALVFFARIGPFSDTGNIGQEFLNTLYAPAELLPHDFAFFVGSLVWRPLYPNENIIKTPKSGWKHQKLS